MRYFLVLIGILFVLTARQNKKSKVTVIFFDNQNPDFKIITDTLLKSKKINFSTTPIDIFFVSRNFKLPYYVPTNGIFKNTAKDKECDMKIYPKTMKCYEYDDKNRVIKMTVHGSWTMNNYSYLYNDKNQIIEVSYSSTKFQLTYNVDGTLSELKQTRPFDKKLVFVYE